jgi:hypothetical protein
MLTTSQKLDAGDPIHQRISKAEGQRQSIVSLNSLFSQYSSMAKKMCDLETKLAAELEGFYQGENLYNGFVRNFANFLRYKDEIIRKEVFEFEHVLASMKGYDKDYEVAAPYFKQYMKHNVKLEHYEKKLPNLLEMAEAKRKTGKAVNADAKRIMRNEKKLEDSRLKTLVATNNIIDLTNKLNIERFEKLNPVVTRFIQYNIALTDFMNEKIGVAQEADFILSQKETLDFNGKYFVELDQRQIDRISKSHMFINPLSQSALTPKPAKSDYTIQTGSTRPQGFEGEIQTSQMIKMNTSNVDLNRSSIRRQDNSLSRRERPSSKSNRMNDDPKSTNQITALNYRESMSRREPGVSRYDIGEPPTTKSYAQILSPVNGA